MCHKFCHKNHIFCHKIAIKFYEICHEKHEIIFKFSARALREATTEIFRLSFMSYFVIHCNTLYRLLHMSYTDLSDHIKNKYFMFSFCIKICKYQFRSWPTVHITPLASKAVTQLITMEMSGYGLMLDAEDQSRILTQCRTADMCNPLYAMVLSSELCRWGSY